MDVEKKGLWETICCQSLEITPALEGIPFPSLISERWADVSLTAGVTDTAARRPDELLSLFALLILLSTAAIQIRAYGPLGSQGGGQPKRCSTSVYQSVHVRVQYDRHYKSFGGKWDWAVGALVSLLNQKP